MSKCCRSGKCESQDTSVATMEPETNTPIIDSNSLYTSAIHLMEECLTMLPQGTDTSKITEAIEDHEAPVMVIWSAVKDAAQNVTGVDPAFWMKMAEACQIIQMGDEAAAREADHAYDEYESPAIDVEDEMTEVQEYLHSEPGTFAMAHKIAEHVSAALTIAKTACVLSATSHDGHYDCEVTEDNAGNMWMHMIQDLSDTVELSTEFWRHLSIAGVYLSKIDYTWSSTMGTRKLD